MSLELPEVGSDAYEALLEETGRSDLVGFDYDAHIAATQGGGASSPAPESDSDAAEGSTAPESEPSETPSAGPTEPAAPTGDSTPEAPSPSADPSVDASLPAEGTAAYAALLLETGRSDLVGFDYAAHLAAKGDTALADFDQYLNAPDVDTLLTLLGAQNLDELGAQASSAQMEALVNQFFDTPEFQAFLEEQTQASGNETLASDDAMTETEANATEPQEGLHHASARLPSIGSAAYKALLLETGRSDLVGFDYAAHLSAKAETSLADFDAYLEAEDGAAVLALLEGQDLNALMASASSAQVQALVDRFVDDDVFLAFLSGQVDPVLPEIGTAAYDALLAETGRSDLEGFDYEAHLAALYAVQDELSGAGVDVHLLGHRRLGGDGDDHLRQDDDESTGSLIGGAGNDTLEAGGAGALMIGGAGDDTLIGKQGLDKAFVNVNKAALRLERQAEAWQLMDDSGQEGVDHLQDVERVLTLDGGIALDLGMDQAAGQVALILGAVFDASAVQNEAYVGVGLQLIDEGMPLQQVCELALNAAGVQAPQDVVNLLWTNVVGSAPDPTVAQVFVDMLDGGMSASELVEFAMYHELNQSQIDLVGLANQGLAFA